MKWPPRLKGSVAKVSETLVILQPKMYTLTCFTKEFVLSHNHHHHSISRKILVDIGVSHTPPVVLGF